MSPPAFGHGLPGRGIARVVASAFASGVVLGLLVRLAMRVVALEACVPQGFSVGGTLEVVAAATLLGAPLAGAFLWVRPRLPMPSSLAGLLWGLAVFATLALLPPPAARAALADTPDTPLATAAAFALCFAAWGVGLGWIERPRSAVRHLLSVR